MATLKKVLLVNPPADGIYFRDLYHTFSSKASYVWQPADMLILSGGLSRDFHITNRDCIGGKLSVSGLLQSLEGHSRFDYIVSMVGSVTLEGDVAALRALKSRFPETKVIVIGDLVREKGKTFLEEYDVVDACLLDFATDNLNEVLRNWDGIDSPRANFVIRKNGEILEGNLRRAKGMFEILTPHHEKFDIYAYGQPVNRKLPVATVLGAVGCPFRCGFCAQGSISYHSRDPQRIFDELLFLKELGVKEIMFRDQLMEGNKRNLKQLCELMIERDLGLTWYCNSRADTLTAELISLMRCAGCHSVLMGIETADDDVLKDLTTRKSGEKTKETISLLRAKGISVLGYFILGLPGETLEKVEETIDLACSLDIDLASFAIPSPDYGTVLRKLAVERGLIDGQSIVNTDRSKESAGLNANLDIDDVEKLVKRAYRAFYFRPRTVLRMILLVGYRPNLILNALRNLFTMIAKQFLTSRRASA